MRPYWQTMGDRDRDAVQALVAFLNGRLADRATIDWALRTTRNDVVKRGAILHALEFLESRTLKEPWRTAWRLIEESWQDEDPDGTSSGAYRAQRRIMTGERTGSLIASIVSFVSPKLEVETRSERTASHRSRRQLRVEDLIRASLSSHELVDLSVYKLEFIDEVDFLVALAMGLEAAVNRGVATGRRIGWDNDHRLWRLGQLYSVSYQRREDGGFGRDVDQFHRGIAPSVKLLHAVTQRLSALNVMEARRLVSGWKQALTPIHFRLWASMALDPALVSPEELSETLPTVTDRAFWDIHTYPEIAELRARRFGELSVRASRTIETRIRRSPPTALYLWPKDLGPDRIAHARLYSSVREYRRIEVAGNQLSRSASEWLTQHIGQFPALQDMESIRFGFLDSGIVRWVGPSPDERFYNLEGEARLQALEASLAEAPRSWADDPEERASEWIREDNNPTRVLADLEVAPDGGAAYPNTWEQLGRSLKAPSRNRDATPEEAQTGERVLRLLVQLPHATLFAAINGISSWLSAWARTISLSPQLADVWAKTWPLAVQATNVASVDPEESNLNEVIAATQDQEPDDLDTLNVPVGRLIDVFLVLCPRIEADQNPFEGNALLRNMRNEIVAAEGKSGLIGRHRLVEELPYFLNADEQWAREHLIAPLAADDDRALALWRSIARRTQSSRVLEIIGNQIATRALDSRLGRDHRGILVSSLVIESLHSFRERRPPAVPNAKTQQTLRAVDDEVRATAAQTVQRYLSELAGLVVQDRRQAAEEILQEAIAPFLMQVWPQERSLATRGVSAAFAELPASAGEAFARAVAAIDPFMVPFDCWSMSDFGLWGDQDGNPKFWPVRTPADAAAFLRLLDLSIGTAEGAVVPMDLAEALEHIQRVSRELVQAGAFRRLATLARRR